MTTPATQLADALEESWRRDTSPDEMLAAAAELRRLDNALRVANETAERCKEVCNATAAHWREDTARLDAEVEALRQALAAFEAQAAMSPKQTSGTSEPVAWSVTFNGEHIGNLYQDLADAQEHKANLDASWPNEVRTVAPLFATPVAQAEPAWQPIETEPPERGLYLVQIGEQTHVAQFDPRMASAKWWHPYGLPARLAQAPSHWMPLPQPPKETP